MKKIALLSLVPVALILASSMASTAAACENGTGFTPGFWKHNIRVALGYPGHYSSFDDSGDHLTFIEVLGYVEATGLWGTGTSALEAALAELTAKGPGSEMIRRDAANALNHVAGYGDYVD